MTQEEKAKAYDKAIKRAKSLIGDTIIEESGQHIAEVIFPELKENEDDRIRKELITWLKNSEGQTLPIDRYNAALAWLEKQKDINVLIQEASEKAYTEGMRVERKRWLEKQGESYTKRDVDNAYLEGMTFAKHELEKQGSTNVFDVPKISIKDAVEVTSRMLYIEDDMKPIADFIIDYANWDLHKDEWNQPTITVPLFRVLDALIQRGKPYCECSLNIEKQSEQKANYTTLVETGNGGINALVTGELSTNGYSEQKSANEVEPKFKVGDWITNGDYTWKIVEVKPLDYILQSQDGNIVDDTIYHVNEQFHSFTIQDAKDGDVLVASDGSIFIFNSLDNDGCKFYVAATVSNKLVINRNLKHHWETSTAVHPATKTQRDILAKAMLSLGYTFDFDKKELNKSNSYCEEHCKGFQETGKCFADGDCKAKIEAEQNPAWSEDDEDLLFWTINNLTELKNRYGKNYGKTGKCITWLKTLKERIGG